jgi:hypothetical protein
MPNLIPAAGTTLIVSGEGDCTVEKLAGQFSIFGAIEEMTAADFCAAM